MTHLTDPVTALLDSETGGLDAGEMLVCPLNERRQLCPFVGNGLTLGVVLVIGIRVRRCGEEGLEIPCHVRESGAHFISFHAQPLGRGLKIKVRPGVARGAIRRGLVWRSGHLHSILQQATPSADIETTGLACSVGQVGVYEMTVSDDGSEIKLKVVSDDCADRRNDLTANSLEEAR